MRCCGIGNGLRDGGFGEFSPGKRGEDAGRQGSARATGAGHHAGLLVLAAEENKEVKEVEEKTS